MENPDVLPRGPRPYGPGRDPSAPMSAARVSVLHRLGAYPDPVPVSVLAEALDQHPNTVREHLDALVDIGMVERRPAPPSGRGRPAILYRALPPESTRPQVREYAALATALAGHLHRTAADPEAEATEAGRAWGGQLVTDTPLDARGCATETVRLLDELGFDPEIPAGAAEDRSPIRVKLRTCPLLDAAQRYPDVVCNVHKGLVHGVYEAHGQDPSGCDVVPFAEPGACWVHLVRGDGA